MTSKVIPIKTPGQAVGVARGVDQPGRVWVRFGPEPTDDLWPDNAGSPHEYRDPPRPTLPIAGVLRDEEVILHGEEFPRKGN